jgi:O-antigen/teichoic acid export membrane protein
MLKEIRFILIFSTALSLILLAPLMAQADFSKPYYSFAIILSLIVSVLFILAFGAEHKSRFAFYLFLISVFFYLFTLPYSYIPLLIVSELLFILQILFSLSVLAIISLDFAQDIFDKDFKFLEKGNNFFYSRMGSFYKLVSGEKHAEKLSTKNN